MNIIIAGAGGGKTSSMAERVLSKRESLEVNKIIYVITYTNAAKNNIKEKVIKKIGVVPENIKIETIHSFLLKEIIYPFNHHIYKEKYTSASHMPLPQRFSFRNMKIKELKNNNIVHVEEVTKAAKYIICGKSSNTKKVKAKQDKILNLMAKYLHTIYLDEAQDIDEEFAEVLLTLEEFGIDIDLIGDPKQNLRGRDGLQKLIQRSAFPVNYESINLRSPEEHVEFANSYINHEEQQNTDKKLGSLTYMFESENFIEEDISNDVYDLCYIYQKNDTFNTHKGDEKYLKQQLSYELKSLIMRKFPIMKEEEKDKLAYVVYKKVLSFIEQGKTNNTIFEALKKGLDISLKSPDIARIGESLSKCREREPQEEGILVNSIDSVKGLEGTNCLFIIDTPLAGYLLKEKIEDNKMKNYLYVGLTRSKQDLTIMLTKKAEEKYGYAKIEETLKSLNINKKE